MIVSFGDNDGEIHRNFLFNWAIPRFLKLVSVMVVSIFFLSGCVGDLDGFPDRPEALEGYEKYFKAEILDEYNSLTEENKKRSKRDEIIAGRMAAIDQVFNDLERAMFQSGTLLNVGSEWAVLGVNAAGTIIGGAATKAALNAVSGGIVGAKGSIDKNLFFEKTMPVLLAEMRAGRKSVMVRIQHGLRQSTNNYPLTAALSDVADYFSSGSIPGAIAGISANSGKAVKDAEVKLEKIVTGQFVKDNATIALRKFWKPDGSAIVKSNNDALRNWMSSNGVNVSITFFLFSDLYADARVKAVSDLGL